MKKTAESILRVEWWNGDSCYYMLYRITNLRGITSQENHHNYSRINVTKSPAASAGDVSEPSLMSQRERVREFVRDTSECFWNQSGGVCQYASAYVAAAIM
jgi:hypothetical protein